MGTFGTALYSNDTALDIKETCDEIFALVPEEEGEAILFRVYKDLLEGDPEDSDYAIFWYVYADWQWKHGILSNRTKEKAIELLQKHAGMDEWLEAGNQKDIAKRIAVLDQLFKKLSSPQPPRKLPMRNTLSFPPSCL